ncbi:MAG TPA: DUF2497 domain-containing protein [Rhizomicrobium sp.]
MANTQHEPTMEEILASIRKIISEDSPSPAATEPASESKAGEAEVLDLTHEVQESSLHSAQAVEFAEPVSADTAEPLHSGDGIFSEKTRNALSEAVAGLDAPAEAAAEQPPLPAGTSVEAVFEKAVREAFDPVLHKWLVDSTDMIVERMKPAIREWLDEHFPAMLEDAVRCELARAVKARSRR